MTRRKDRLLGDIVDAVSKFPWWIALVLAVVAYLPMHYLASMELPPSSGIKDLGAVIAVQIAKTLGMFGQYILPLALLIGSAASLLRRRTRGRLHRSVAAEDRALEDLSWREFELLVGEFFREREFAVEETDGGGADGGVDLIVSVGGDRYAVQCKQWKARQVGVAVVRELYGVMAAKGFVGGFVVTSGAFTEDAKLFAEGREIELIDSEELLDLMRDRQQRPVGKGISATSTPSCPRCNAPMALRTARRGARAGTSFWGCSNYPHCRGTRPV